MAYNAREGIETHSVVFHISVPFSQNNLAIQKYMHYR